MFSSSIDWGSLAQQWIQMQDNTSRTIPEAPPPPNISGVSRGGPSMRESSTRRTENRKSKFEEQGEADMELADDEDHSEKGVKPLGAPNPPIQTVHQIGGAPVADNALIMQPPWFVQTAQAPPIAVPSQITASASQWNVWPPRVTVPPPTLSGTAVNPTAHIPSLLKINVPNPNVIKPLPDIVESTITDPSAANNSNVGAAEAAKRKILPAWIREGLEKMEREKQKQMEREHYQQSNSDSVLPNVQADVKNAENLLECTVKKSTVDKILESDSSCNEGEDVDGVPAKTVALAAPTAPSENDNSDIDGTQISGKSYEQKLNDLMIVVRGTLTELLLEVTTEEIANIAQETLKTQKIKASSAQVVRKSDLSSITGKLGLAAYADSSSDESNDSDNDAQAGKDNGSNDSEEELQNSIRMKRRAFAKTSEEIEQRIAANAAREEQKLKYYMQLEENHKSNSKIDEPNSEQSYQHTVDRKRHDGDHFGGKYTSTSSGGKTIERDFGETTTVSKLHHSNGKRHRDRHQRKERTTRFSDNKEPKVAATVNYISQMHFSTHSANAEAPRAIGCPVQSSSGVGPNLHNAPIPNPAELTSSKASKVKSSPTRSDRKRRRSRSESSSSSTSSDSDSSSSSSSRSTNSSKNRKHRRRREESSRSRYRKTSSSSYHRRDNKKGYSKDRRDQRKYSSDSEDASNYYRHSRHSRRQSKSRSISRSQSKSSYSSNRHRR